MNKQNNFKHTRNWVLLLLTAVLMLSVFSVAFADDDLSAFEENFADPSSDYSMKVRTWWPSADITDEEIYAEVQEIAEAGFGGMEIIAINENFGDIDSDTYGWGSEAWLHAMDVLVEAAELYDVNIDFTIGPRWPAGVPGLDPESEAAQQQLMCAADTIEADGETATTYDLPLADTEYSAELITLVAALVDEDGYTLDTDSLIEVDLADVDTDASTFVWTAPSAGEWTIFAYWQTACVQESGSASPTAYVVDHFSLAGTEAIIEYWEENMLTDAVREYLEENGGALFEDSLELDVGYLPWTTEFAEYFEERNGYSILVYLPLINNQILDNWGVSDQTEETALIDRLYTGTDEDLQSRVYNDFVATVSDMYIEYHLIPIQEWLEEEFDGMVNFRVQAQGTENTGFIDSIDAHSYVGISEGESLGFTNSGVDAFRSVAGGAHMGGNQIISDELGANMMAGASTTIQEVLESLNLNAAGGANQFQLHGYATQSQQSETTAWPGWQPFGSIFGEGWNFDTVWDYMDDVITNYASRLTYVLQYGTSDVDFAVYRYSMGIRVDRLYAGNLLEDSDAEDWGYSYNYISPNNFDLETAYVDENGEFNPEYAGFQALVISGEETMTLEAAEYILSFAEAGLPIILIGETPTTSGSLDEEGTDEEVAAIFEELMSGSIDTVVWIETEEELTSALLDLGITPASYYSEAVSVYSLHRSTDDLDLYYFYNHSTSTTSEEVNTIGVENEYPDMDADIEISITLEGSGVPYLLDAVTGEITPIAEYTVSEDGITIDLMIENCEAKIIAITEAEDFCSNEAVIIETLDDQAIDLTNETWTLDVTSYEPGENALLDATDENYDAYDTEYVALDTITLDGLKLWDEIAELEGISGQALYTITFTCDSVADGAYLSIGYTLDTVLEVAVNGVVVGPMDQWTHKVDMEDNLVEGENTITILLGTTLKAATDAAGTGQAGSGNSPYNGAYGLLGDVIITPYESTPVAE